MKFTISKRITETKDVSQINRFNSIKKTNVSQVIDTSSQTKQIERKQIGLISQKPNAPKQIEIISQ